MASVLIAIAFLLLPCVCAAWNSVNVEAFGAIGDNKTDNTNAFRDAFQAVSGGGEVVVSAGKVYRTAPFNLTSHVVLRVDGVVRGVENFHAFPIIQILPSYGHDLDVCSGATQPNLPQCQQRRHPLVYAVGASNISIVGTGVIDGAGEYWWPHFYNTSIDPHVGRPHLIELNNCTDIEITGVTLLNSAFWTLHPIYCRNVYIHHMKLLSPWCQNYKCANTDGIDIDSTRDVVIAHNYISCGDDHVTILAGAGEEGLAIAMPSKNVTVRDNRLGTGMGLSIGSSVSGGVEDVLYTRNVMDETAGEWGQGAHIKTRVTYGGYVRNVAWADNIFHVAGSPGGAIKIETGYQSSGQCTATTCTEIRDIVFRNLTVNKGGAGSIDCYPARPCINITFDNIHIQSGAWGACNNVASGTVYNVTPAGLAESCGFERSESAFV